MRKRTKRRSGAAVVELAVCLPVIFLLLMASLEICTKIFLLETLTVAAYETAIEGARTGGTTTSAVARGTAILSSRGVQGYAITISPAPDSAAMGTTLTVTVTAPSSSNSVVPVQKFNTGTLRAEVRAVKEAT
jgi:hypothetical protein